MTTITSHARRPRPVRVLLPQWRQAREAVPAITAWLRGPAGNVPPLSRHPDGMGPRILTLARWRAHLLTQLRHRSHALGDDRLMELQSELLGYPGGPPAVVRADGAASPAGHRSRPGVVLPLRYLHGERDLSFFSISASVSTATDVTVEELTIEAFYPADAATAAALKCTAR